MSLIKLSQRFAPITAISGQTLYAALTDVAIGEMCSIYPDATSIECAGNAQVVALQGDIATLSALSSVEGFKREYVVRPMGKGMSITASSALLGSIINARGVVDGRFTPSVATASDARELSWERGAPHYSERDGRAALLTTGIKAVDGLLTCALGQRIGIFAAAGSGKTSLLSMLMHGVQADVAVVALVGERGREVTEFIERARENADCRQLILVYATSDQSAVERANAAKVATLVAEFFRDNGLNVALYVDSLTRYARAERDIALAAGAMPVKRGYPISVFDSLPKLIERAGRTRQGSITAFYTVLLESEEEADIVADEFRSLLDGHIYLSRALAEKYHYPPIDLLKSASRMFNAVTDADHQRFAGKLREYLSKYQELRFYLDLGEYKQGQNAENDMAIDAYDQCRKFLLQRAGNYFPFQDTMQLLQNAVEA